MRFLVLMCCVWLASAGTVPDKCNGVTFDGKYYDKEVLTAARLADNFSFQKGTNTLFFSYASPTNMTEEHFIGVAYYNLDTKEFRDIPDVPAGSTTTVNPATDEVFLAGNNGVQKFNPLTKGADPYTAEGVNIYYMVFDNILYYTTYPNYEIYTYDGQETKKISNDTVQSFLGDKDGSYYVNKIGLFRIVNQNKETAEKFADADSNDYIVFARDNNKKIFVVRQSGVYVPNVKDKKLDKVFSGHTHGLTFDKDNNIIYSDHDHIYKLTPSQSKCTPA